MLELLRAVRLDYDEEYGEIGKQRFKQIMKLISQKDDIPDLC